MIIKRHYIRIVKSEERRVIYERVWLFSIQKRNRCGVKLFGSATAREICDNIRSRINAMRGADNVPT
jgi:hypothetical protein